MKNHVERGLLSAILTPFNDDGSIRESAIKEMVDFEIERGMKGFYVNGSTGEGMVMNEEERMQVVEAVVKAVAGRAQVIVHVGTTDTYSAIRMAKHAEKVGAQGVSSISPFYYVHDMSFIVDYFKDLASSTNLPFLIYNSSEGRSLNFKDVMKLYDIENIVGMKYTIDNLEILNKIKEARPDKLMFMGHDAMCLSALVSGADGEIGAFPNVMPAGFMKVWDSFNKKDLEAAMNEQFRLNHFITIMKNHMLSANQAPLKVVMQHFGVDCGTNLRRPAKPLDKECADHLISVLTKDNFFEIYK